MRAGDASDAAYFVLGGRAVAGLAREGEPQHTLSTMTAGDIFGEIAALTGGTRTADVVAEEPTHVARGPGRHAPAPDGASPSSASSSRAR